MLLWPCCHLKRGCLSQPLISIHSVMLISFGGFFAEYFVDESTNCSIFKTLENSEQSPLVTSIVINSWQINFPVSWRNNRSSFRFILIIFTQKKIIFRCKMSESAEIIHNFLAKAKKRSLGRVWFPRMVLHRISFVSRVTGYKCFNNSAGFPPTNLNKTANNRNNMISIMYNQPFATSKW